MMRPTLFRLPNTLPHDPAITTYFAAQPPHLHAIAEPWFQRLRSCGDEVRELLHDGHPTACLGVAAFAYVAIFPHTSTSASSRAQPCLTPPTSSRVPASSCAT